MNKQSMLSKIKEWCDKPFVEQKLLRFIPVYKLSYLQTTERGKSKPNPGLRTSQYFSVRGSYLWMLGRLLLFAQFPLLLGHAI